MSRLSVENVSFTYGEKPILKNVSLAVEQGELVAILGHNGSGKTTLLRLIAGFEKPDDGDPHGGHGAHWRTSRFQPFRKKARAAHGACAAKPGNGI